MPARALPRVGPAVVEHIFALAVRLEIGGRGGDQMRGVVLDQDRRRGPAGAGPDAARIFERGEESVAEEWVAGGSLSQARGIEAGNAGGDLGEDFGFAVGHTR